MQLLLIASISPQKLFQGLPKFKTFWFSSTWQEFLHDPIKACTSNVRVCDEATEFRGGGWVLVTKIKRCNFPLMIVTFPFPPLTLATSRLCLPTLSKFSKRRISKTYIRARADGSSIHQVVGACDVPSTPSTHNHILSSFT